jgi:hypothetical protein
MVKHSQAECLQEMKLGVSRYTSEDKAETMTWKHPHSSAKFKTGQPTGKVMAADTAVLWSYVGLFHTSRFNNELNCFSGK